MATAGSIATKVLKRLGEEDPSNPVFWSRVEILEDLSEIYLEFLLTVANQVRTDLTVTLAAASAFANVPNGIIAILDLWVSDKPLEKYTLEALDLEERKWETQTGSPDKWAPIGLNLIASAKRPSADTSASVTALKYPGDLAEETAIDLPDEMLTALEEGTFHVARFKEGSPEFANSMPSYEFFLKSSMEFAERAAAYGQEHPNQSTGSAYTTVRTVK